MFGRRVGRLNSVYIPNVLLQCSFRQNYGYGYRGVRGNANRASELFRALLWDLVSLLRDKSAMKTIAICRKRGPPVHQSFATNNGNILDLEQERPYLPDNVP